MKIIKTILISLSIFTMSTFLLPLGVLAQTNGDVCPPLKYQGDPNNLTRCESSNPPNVPLCITDSETIQEFCYTCIAEKCLLLEEPLPPVPGLEITSLETYIKYAYQIGLGIVGVTALIMIIYGGVLYVTSAGNQGKIGNAKKYIQDAILGLLLALGAYLILFTINPDLVRISKVQLQYPDLPKFVLRCDEGLNTCRAEKVTPGTDKSTLVDTCAQAGSSCFPTCKITNVYWGKQSAKIGDDIKIVIEARGLCGKASGADGPELGTIDITEKDTYSDDFIWENVTVSPFKKSFPYYTSETIWTIEDVPVGWWTRFTEFGNPEYIIRAAILDMDADGNAQYYIKESGPLVISELSDEERAEIAKNCTASVDWDKSSAKINTDAGWTITSSQCGGIEYNLKITKPGVGFKPTITETITGKGFLSFKDKLIKNDYAVGKSGDYILKLNIVTKGETVESDALKVSP